MRSFTCCELRCRGKIYQHATALTRRRTIVSTVGLAGHLEVPFRSTGIEIARQYLIDSAIVKAHRAASGAKGEKNQAISISRGGRTTKIHAIRDSNEIALPVIPNCCTAIRKAYCPSAEAA